MSKNIGNWNFCIFSKGTMIFRDWGYETAEDAEDAAMAYIKENNVTDYSLDISMPAV